MNILLSYRAYPVTIGRYFKWALQRLGHNVFHVGAFSREIPWAAGMDFSDYIDTPDYITPNVNEWDVVNALNHIPSPVDAIISVDAAYRLANVKDTNIPNAIILSDPHALPDWYTESCEHYEHIFSMQNCYAHLFSFGRNGKKRPVFWLPYAADTQVHYWNGQDFTARPFDLMIISGLMYPMRRAAFEVMQSVGLNALNPMGLLYEKASAAYGQAVIAYNWSSENDLCARFFEGLSMRNLVLTNRVPDLALFSDLVENEHYIAFDTLDECVEKAMYYASHRDEAWRIASKGYAQFWASNHTYLSRMERVLDVLFPKT